MLLSFVRKVLVFLSIPLALMVGVAAVVPPTPRSATSLLFAKLDKDRLLRTTPGPRLILVGGSNLSFGIDSPLLEAELHVHPVNMGLHASLGLKYMLDSLLPYVQPGDTVVLVPEYSQFFGKRAYGGAELLRLLCDVDRTGLWQLSPLQWANILPELPKFALSKLRPNEYFFAPADQIGIYDRAAFNQYGDAVAHWGLAPEPFAPYKPAGEPLNAEMPAEIKAFERQLGEHGATLYVSFPGLQESSFQQLREQAGAVEAALRAQGLRLLGSPERYRIPDYLVFNTPYHLTQAGADQRTRLLIADLQAALGTP